MPREIIRTSNAPDRPATYSQAVKAAGPVFGSGTAPVDPATGRLVEGGAGERTAMCLRNIAAILEAAGSCLQKVVSATIIFRDPDDFAAINEEWLKWFPANPPARQGARLPASAPGLKVSIALIAEA